MSREQGEEGRGECVDGALGRALKVGNREKRAEGSAWMARSGEP